jgi:hypothetical protein
MKPIKMKLNFRDDNRKIVKQDCEIRRTRKTKYKNEAYIVGASFGWWISLDYTRKDILWLTKR